jgi:ribulose 1,5-bisphosphate carboxylase large subunit-like protein
MATSAAGAPRRRLQPGQGTLLVAALLVALGAVLPWVQTVAGNVSGMRGPGLWTFYAAALGVAGGLVPSRRAAAVQGGALAVAAVGLAAWQVVHLLRLVGTAGWVPGPGLVLTVGGGVLAGAAARTLLARR